MRSHRVEQEGTLSHRRATSSPRAICLLIAIVAIAACKQETAPQAPPPPPDVIVADVLQKDVPIYVEWVGTTDGNVNAQIRARVNGYLQARNYNEGTFVRTGEMMFSIDPRPYQAALDQAKGELGRADAAFTKAQQDVKRYTPLAAEGAISQEELDNAVQAQRAASAMVDAGRAAVEKAKLDLDWTRITSPIDGISGIAIAQIGDLINANSVLTTVSQVDPIKVSVPVSEQDYLRYSRSLRLEKPGQAAPNLELILSDGSVHKERGTVSVADRQVDIQTGTMMFVALFPNPNNLLRPGQYAKVRATTETRTGALLVPQRAVQELQGTFQVAVVSPDNKVAMRIVKAGPRVGSSWLIEDGLKPGERVIVEGLQKVRDGATVNPRPADAPNPTDAAANS